MHILHSLLLLGLIFSAGVLPIQDLFAQNTNDYLGPKSPVSGLIRVQVMLYDSPEQGGLQIESAEFDQTPIKLKPRDIRGFRGQSSFQVLPGTYKLKWTVQRDKHVWPRTIAHEEIVTINPRDLWVQISVVGEKATIL